MMSRHEKQKNLEQAIKFICQGLDLMGWDLLIPECPITHYMIIGDNKTLEQLQRLISFDKFEQVSQQEESTDEIT